jgi:heparin binding hemagglutinin HbhA
MATNPNMMKPDLSKTTAELKQAAYVVAGVGDLAVEKLREVPAKVSKIGADLRGPDNTVSVKSVQAKVSEAVLSIPAEALQLTAKISTLAEGGVKKAESQYKDLANRGEAIVRRIGNQKATQDLINQAQSTVTRARVARGAAQRGAENTKVAAKGTATSARKTAGKATKAASDGAAKVGD